MVHKKDAAIALWIGGWLSARDYRGNCTLGLWAAKYQQTWRSHCTLGWRAAKCQQRRRQG